MDSVPENVKVDIELVPCTVFSERVHINTCCRNNFNNCWKNASKKDVVKIKLETLEDGGFVRIVTNRQLLEG